MGLGSLKQCYIPSNSMTMFCRLSPLRFLLWPMFLPMLVFIFSKEESQLQSDVGSTEHKCQSGSNSI
jgi:hypothetical protein